MSKLRQTQHLIFGKMVHLIGLFLCVYFSYHCLAGNRSAFALTHLKSQTEALSQKLDSAQKEKAQLERKVIAMRPGHIDVDLLEEQVRKTLGYQSTQEIAFLK